MKSPKTSACDACLEAADPTTLTEICGDWVCSTCIKDVDNHYNREDLEDFNEDWDYVPQTMPVVEVQQFDDMFYWADDDPNPYHGNYSEC